MAYKFKVGDKVVIKSDDYPLDNFKRGTVSTVIRVPRTSATNGIYQVGDQNHLFYERELELFKEEPMKEIIGYNIKKEYQDKEEQIAGALKCAKGLDTNGCWIQYITRTDKAPTGVASRAKKLGVLDLWFEPVYKQSEIIVKLSKNRKAVVKDKLKADVALADGSSFSIVAIDVDRTLDAFNKLGQIAGYNVGVKEFQLGCQTFTITDLQAVAQAFKDFK